MGQLTSRVDKILCFAKPISYTGSTFDHLVIHHTCLLPSEAIQFIGGCIQVFMQGYIQASPTCMGNGDSGHVTSFSAREIFKGIYSAQHPTDQPKIQFQTQSLQHNKVEQTPLWSGNPELTSASLKTNSEHYPTSTKSISLHSTRPHPQHISAGSPPIHNIPTSMNTAHVTGPPSSINLPMTTTHPGPISQNQHPIPSPHHNSRILRSPPAGLPKA